MKELIYHRMFFPGLRNHAKKTVLVNGAHEATFEQHADRVE